MTVAPTLDRASLVHRAQVLARLGLAWHFIEAAVALASGIVAGSIALVGFGADSLVEGAAGLILLWRFSTRGMPDEAAERRAQKLIGLSFYAIAVYVGVDAVRALFERQHPAASWTGIVLALVTCLTMPPLAVAKSRVGERL